MQNRPFRTPISALAIHLGVTIIFICAPPAGDAFDFIISLSSYPTVLLLTAVTFGLIKLRWSKDEDSGSAFKVPWAVLAFYLAANIVCSACLLIVGDDILTILTVPPRHAICSAA
jgi:amino acid transporter